MLRKYSANLRLVMLLGTICLVTLFFVPVFTQIQPDKKAEKIRFVIKTLGENDKKRGKLTFKVGEKIIIKTLIKNESSEPIPLSKTDSAYQYRFQLWKTGKKGVAFFRQDKAEHLLKRENDPGPGMNMTLAPIKSGESIELETFNLEDFYEKLEPGQYKLTVFYRPGGRDYGKRKVASNTLILEIVQ